MIEDACDEILGDGEGAGHARAAEAGEEDGAGSEFADELGALEHFEVLAGPTAGDGCVGEVEHASEVIEDEAFDLGGVEGGDGGVVFVGVADGEFAFLGLRDHDMDTELFILGEIACEAAAEVFEAGADSEGGVVPERESAGEHGADAFGAGEGGGAHHLELAACEAGLLSGDSGEGQEIDAGADPGAIAGGEDFGSGADRGGGAIGDGYSPEEVDFSDAFEPAGEQRGDLAGIDGDFGAAPEPSAEVFGLDARGPGADIGWIEPLDVVAEIGRGGGEFPEDGGLIIGEGEVEGAGFGIVPDTGDGEEFEPDFAGTERLLECGPGGLSDGPDHAEVTDGGALGGGVLFDDEDFPAALGEGFGQSESGDAGADDDIIKIFIVHAFTQASDARATRSR